MWWLIGLLECPVLYLFLNGYIYIFNNPTHSLYCLLPPIATQPDKGIVLKLVVVALSASL